MARAAGGRVISPGVAGQGLNPFVIDRRDDEELLQRIGSLRRLIEVMVGERLGAERRAALDHALAGYYAEPREGRGLCLLLPLPPGERRRPGEAACVPSLPAASVTSSRTRATTSSRRRRSSPSSTCTCWSPSCGPPRPWSAPRRSGRRPRATPKPRLLVVDEVWSIMQHPEGAAFMVSMAKRARKHRLGLQFITQDVQDLLSEDSSRTITGHSGQSAPPERRLQAPPPTGRRRHQHRRRRLRPSSRPAALAPLLPAR